MFSVLWCCSAWGEPALFRAGQFLESSEGWTWGVPLTCGPLVHSHAASTGPRTPGGNIPLPEPSKARNQAPRDCSHSLAPVKLFKLASRKLAYSAFPFSAHGNHNKDTCPHSPLHPPTSWLTTVLPPCTPSTPRGITCPSSWKLSNKLSFQWQLSPDFLALPLLNNNKTYILKQ